MTELLFRKKENVECCSSISETESIVSTIIMITIMRLMACEPPFLQTHQKRSTSRMKPFLLIINWYSIIKIKLIINNKSLAYSRAKVLEKEIRSRLIPPVDSVYWWVSLVIPLAFSLSFLSFSVILSSFVSFDLVVYAAAANSGFARPGINIRTGLARLHVSNSTLVPEVADLSVIALLRPVL